ncbi:MAG: MoaD/ThiS family protein [Methylophilaceae bacterium]
MAIIVCTHHLGHVGPLAPVSYQGETVSDVLDAAAVDYPRLKSYVLDDQGRVRKHVAIFVDGTLQPRETVLNYVLDATDEIYIMQALSGG